MITVKRPAKWQHGIRFRGKSLWGRMSHAHLERKDISPSSPLKNKQNKPFKASGDLQIHSEMSHGHQDLLSFYDQRWKKYKTRLETEKCFWCPISRWLPFLWRAFLCMWLSDSSKMNIKSTSDKNSQVQFKNIFVSNVNMGHLHML